MLLWALACPAQDPADAGTDGIADTDDTDDTDDTADTATGDTAVCGPNAPTWQYFEVSQGAVGTDGFPALRFDVYVEDVDEDLDTIVVDVWFDTLVDGAVDTSAAPPITTGEIVKKDGACGVPVAATNFEIPVDGTPFLGETAYEFGVVVTDLGGHASAPALDAETTGAIP